MVQAVYREAFLRSLKEKTQVQINCLLKWFDMKSEVRKQRNARHAGDPRI
jgi:hypothetical protein